jgi:hypothetical protein
MFKKLEKKWNAHTPIWLHNGTKENFIFQLTAGVLIILGFTVRDRWEERRFNRRYPDLTLVKND